MSANKVKVGDLIRIIDDEDSICYANGDILTVVEEGVDGEVYAKTHSNMVVYVSDYEFEKVQPEVGDIIEVVSVMYPALDHYEVGDKLTVHEVLETGEVFAKFAECLDEEHLLCEEEYVIHRKAGEDDSEVNSGVGNMKAQKGDLIRITGDCDGALNIGDIVEVTDEYATHLGVFVKGAHYVRHANYVIHRKANEESTCSNCGKHGVHTCRGAEYYAEAVEGKSVKLPAIKYHTSYDATDAQIRLANEIEPTAQIRPDAVNPQHYKQGRVEVIDVIEDAVQGADPFEAVCQANVLKYVLRYRHKNGAEDLRKAQWYLEKLVAHIDE